MYIVYLTTVPLRLHVCSPGPAVPYTYSSEDGVVLVSSLLVNKVLINFSVLLTMAVTNNGDKIGSIKEV